MKEFFIKLSKLGKRSLSIVLCLTMLITTFCFFDIGSVMSEAMITKKTNSIAKSTDAGNFFAEYDLKVPEMIYVQPGGTVSEYFLNTTTTEATSSEGDFTFNCSTMTGLKVYVKLLDENMSDTTANRITNVTFGDGNARSVSSTAETLIYSYSNSALMTNIKSITFNSNEASTIKTKSKQYFIQWKFEYVLGNGNSFYVYAYTGVKFPYLGQAGMAAYSRYKSDGSRPYLYTYSFITGLDSVSGGNASSNFVNAYTSGSYTPDNLIAPLSKFYGSSSKDNGSWSMPNIGDEKKYLNAYSVVSNVGFDSKYFTERYGGGVFSTVVNDDDYSVIWKVKNYDPYEPNGYDPRKYNEKYFDDSETGWAYNQGNGYGRGNLVVDTSRYSNFSQIPNFKSGWVELKYHYYGEGNFIANIDNCVYYDNDPYDSWKSSNTHTANNNGKAGWSAATIYTTVDNRSIEGSESNSYVRGLYTMEGDISAFKADTINTHKSGNNYSTHFRYEFKNAYDPVIGSTRRNCNINTVGFTFTDVNKSDARAKLRKLMTSGINDAASNWSSKILPYIKSLSKFLGNSTDTAAPSITDIDSQITTGKNSCKSSDRMKAPETKKLYFVVPEAIYLKPTTGTTSSFEYILDSKNTISNGAVTSTLNAGDEKIGSSDLTGITFYYANAINVTIQASSDDLTAIGFTVNNSLGTANNSAKNISTGSNTIQAGIRSGTAKYSAGSNKFIKWTVTFYDTSDGLQKRIMAYTAIYSPIIDCAASSIATSFDKYGTSNDRYLTTTYWITGGHKIENRTGTLNDHDDQKADVKTGRSFDRPLVDTNGLSTNATISLGGNTGTGNCQWPVDVPTGVGATFFRGDKDVNDKAIDCYGGTLTVYADLSRTTKYDNIPNLYIGYDVNHNDHCSQATETNSASYTITDTQKTFDPTTTGRKFALHFSGAITAGDHTLKGQASARLKDDGDRRCRPRNFIYLKTITYNKSELRKTVSECMKDTPVLQKHFFYNSTGSTYAFDKFRNLLEAAHKALGTVGEISVSANGTTYTDLGALKNALESAYNTLFGQSSQRRTNLSANQYNIIFEPDYKVHKNKLQQNKETTTYNAYDSLTFTKNNIKGTTYQGLVQYDNAPTFTDNQTYSAPSYRTAALNSGAMDKGGATLFDKNNGTLGFTHSIAFGNSTSLDSGSVAGYHIAFFYMLDQFTVAYNTNEGSGTFNNQTATYDKTMTLRGEPTRTGYTFKGWSDGTEIFAANSTVSIETIEKWYDKVGKNGTITLTAVWEANKYNITFDNEFYFEKLGNIQNGTNRCAVTKDATKNTVTLTATEDATSNFAYSGPWNGDTSSQMKIVPGHTYRIYANVFAGNTVSTTGSIKVRILVFPYTNAGDTSSTRNLATSLVIINRGERGVIDFTDVLTAASNENYLRIRFDLVGVANDSATYSNIAIQDISYPDPPSDKSTSKPTIAAAEGSDSAVYIEKFTFDKSLNDIELFGNDLPSATRNGYTFAGWNTAKDGSGTAYDSTTVMSGEANAKDIHLFSQWTINKYRLDVNGYCTDLSRIEGGAYDIDPDNSDTSTNRINAVKFNVTNGSNTTSGVVDYCTDNNPYNTPFSVSNFTNQTGYVFTGVNTSYSNSAYVKQNWDSTNKVYSGYIGYGGKTTYVAVEFRRANFTIAYNIGAATSGQPSATSAKYNVAGKLTSTVPVRAGYKFTGWKASNGTVYSTGQSLTATQIRAIYANNGGSDGGTITLTAQWTETLVSFDVNHDSINTNLFAPINPSSNQSKNGLTVLYNESTGVVTIDGTQTASANPLIRSVFKPEVGAYYRLSITLVGGSKTAGNGSLILDCRKKDGSNISTRTNIDTFSSAINFDSSGMITHPTATSQNIKTFTAALAAETEYIDFWIWQNTTANVFNSFQIKIKVEKVNSASDLYTAPSPYRRLISGSVYGSLPAEPGRTGYTFNGWYTAKTGGSKITDTSAYVSTTSHTLYAQWTENSYNLLINPNNGSIAANAIKKGSTAMNTSAISGSGFSAAGSAKFTDIITLPTPTKAGWTFKGWVLSGGSADSARWGTSSNPTTVITTDTPFGGGSTTVYLKSLDSANGNNITLTAKWERTITVNAFYLNTSNNYTLVKTNTLTYVDSETSKTISNIYGLSDNPGTVTINSNSYTYAGYRADTTAAAATTTGSSYTLNIASDGSTKTVNLCAVYKHGFTITYNKNSSATVSDMPSQATVTKYYNATSTTSSTAVTYKTANASYTTATTMPKRDNGYTCLGWSETAGATSATYTTSANKIEDVTKNYTLYAVWRKGFKVTMHTYNNQIFNGEPIYVYVYGDATSKSYTPPVPGATSNGYTFRGWSTGTGATASTATSFTITGDTNLYASYYKTVTATFYYNNTTSGTTLGKATATSSATQYMNYTGSISNSNITIPEVVAKSSGAGMAEYKGVSSSTNSTSTENPTTAKTNYYAVYTKAVKFYHGGTGTETAATRKVLYSGSAYVCSMENQPSPAAYNSAGFKHWSNNNASYASSTMVTPNACTDTTFYAVYSKNISITYNGNTTDTTLANVPTTTSGTGYYISKVGGVNTAGLSLTVSSTKPTRNGYTFLGWSTSNSATAANASYGPGQTVSFDNANTKIDLYAVWKEYTVTINTTANKATSPTEVSGYSTANNGGTVTFTATSINGNKVAQGAKVTVTATPAAGYKFDGLYTTADGASVAAGTTVSENTCTFTMPGSNVTYYARFSLKSHKISFNIAENGGTGTVPATVSTVYYGQTYTFSQTATKTNWKFVGWNTNKNATTAQASYKMGDADVTVYAIYSCTPKLTFKYIGTDGAAKSTAVNCTTVYNKATSTTCTAATVSSIATWTELGYSTSTTYSATGNTKEGASITVSTMKDATSVGTYYMNYNREISLSYNNNYNSATSTEDANSPKIATWNAGANATYQSYTITATAPTRAGYTFLGWNTNKDATTATYQCNGTITPTSNTTLYAIWTAYKLDVYAYSNIATNATTASTEYKNNTTGGTVSITANDFTADITGNATEHASAKLTEGKTAKISMVAKTASGYKFDGWYTSTDFTGTPVATTAELTTTSMGNAGLKYYAKFSIQKYTLKFDAATNGGTGAPSAVNVYYGQTYSFDTNTQKATKTGWNFVGWNESKTAQTAQSSVIMNSTSGKTVYAIFNKTITVTYYYNENGTTKSVSDSYTMYNTSTSVSVTLRTTGTGTGSTTVNGVKYDFVKWVGDSGATNGTKITTATLSESKSYYANYTATITATFYYNNTTSGTTLTQATKTATAIRYMNYNGNFGYTGYTIPTEVSSSKGAGMADYIGVSASTSSTTTCTPKSDKTKFYAVYTRNITFYYRDSSTNTSAERVRRVLTDGTTYRCTLNTEAPKSSDYNSAKFDHWSAVKTTYSTTVVPTENESNIFYAVSKKSISITYNANKGTNAPSSSTGTGYYISSDAGITPYNLTLTVKDKGSMSRVGYNFLGWSTSASGAANSSYAPNSKVDFTDSKTTVALYAVWGNNIYKIAYDLNKGTGSSEVTNGSGNPTTAKFDEAFKVNAPTRDGYTFIGWTVSSGLNTSYAKWGTSSANTNLTSSETLCVNGTNAVYFINLHTGDKTGTVGVTLKANWQKKTYTIGYDLNDASKGNGSTTAINGSNNPTSATFDTEFIVSVPTRVGYIFIGWTVSSGLNTKYAKWGKTSANTAITSSTVMCVDGSNAIYFINLTASGTVTLKANWQAITYTVTFDVGTSGTAGYFPTDKVTNNSTITYTATYDTPFQVSDATNSKAGWYFEGWKLTGADAKYTEDINDNGAKFGKAANSCYNTISENEIFSMKPLFVTNLTTVNNGKVTLKASWSKSCTVQFHYIDANGISQIKRVTTTFSDSIRERTVTMNGTFGNLTVFISGDDGQEPVSFNELVKTVRWGSYVGLKDRTITFLGWRTDATPGNATLTNSSEFAANATEADWVYVDYYAVYSGDVTLNYNLSGGTWSRSTTTDKKSLCVNAGTVDNNNVSTQYYQKVRFNIVSTIPTKQSNGNSLKFLGWSEYDAGSSQHYSVKYIAGNETDEYDSDKTIYAVFIDEKKAEDIAGEIQENDYEQYQYDVFEGIEIDKDGNMVEKYREGKLDRFNNENGKYDDFMTAYNLYLTAKANYDLNPRNTNYATAFAIAASNLLSQTMPVENKIVSNVDSFNIHYTDGKEHEFEGRHSVQEMNLNHYLTEKLDEVKEKYTEAKGYANTSAMNQPKLNRAIAVIAKDFVSPIDFNAGSTPTQKREVEPTYNVIETKKGVEKYLGENGVTSVNYAFSRLGGYTYYFYVNTLNPKIVITVDELINNSGFGRESRACYPTSLQNVVSNGKNADANLTYKMVKAAEENPYQKYLDNGLGTGVVEYFDENVKVDGKYSKKQTIYSSANANENYYNIKQEIVLEPVFTDELNSKAGKGDIWVEYKFVASDDSMNKELASTANLTGKTGTVNTINGSPVDGNQETNLDSTITSENQITIKICYHRGLVENGNLVSIGATAAQVSADKYLNQYHLFRTSGGASNTELPMPNEYNSDHRKYTVNDPTYGQTDYGSFTYTFMQGADSVADSKINITPITTDSTSVSTKQNVDKVIEFIKKNHGNLKSFEGSKTGTGLGYQTWSQKSWSYNYYPKSEAYTYVHLVDRWGNTFDGIFYVGKIDAKSAKITSNAASSITIVEDGGSGIATANLNTSSVQIIPDENSVLENGVYTTKGNKVTLKTETPNKSYTLKVDDKATNSTTASVKTDADGCLTLIVEDNMYDNDGTYTFTLNGMEINLYDGAKKHIKSVFAEDAMLGQKAKVEVVTSDEVEKLQLIDGKGNTITRSTCDSKNDNGTMTWSYELSKSAGEHQYTVKVKVGGQWLDESKTVSFIVMVPEKVSGAIKNVQFNAETGEYIVTADKRAIKIQFVDEQGNTYTFDRHNGFVSGIKGYNAENEEVNSESRLLDHEDWTIAVKLSGGNYTAIGKYDSGWCKAESEIFTFQSNLSR